MGQDGMGWNGVLGEIHASHVGNVKRDGQKSAGNGL